MFGRSKDAQRIRETVESLFVDPCGRKGPYQIDNDSEVGLSNKEIVVLYNGEIDGFSIGIAWWKDKPWAQFRKNQCVLVMRWNGEPEPQEHSQTQIETIQKPTKLGFPQYNGAQWFPVPPVFNEVILRHLVQSGLVSPDPEQIARSLGIYRNVCEMPNV